MWPVPENNGTVFVCVNISNGIARELPIIVVASEKVADNAATGEYTLLTASSHLYDNAMSAIVIFITRKCCQ